MKQIGLGLMQYLQDNDERYPRSWCGTDNVATPPTGDCVTVSDSSVPAGYFTVGRNGSGSPATGNYRTWMDYIFPYIKSVQVFVCPYKSSPATDPDYGYSTAFSGYSSHTSAYGGSPANYTPILTAAVKRPAQTIVVTEVSHRINYTAGPRNVYDNAVHATVANHKLVAPHLDGGVAIFADGHAKWRSRTTVATEVSTNSTGTYSTVPTTGNCTDGTQASAYCSTSWNPYLD